MNSKDVIRALEKDGWYLVNIVGSHHQFKHPTKAGKVTVPHPRKDVVMRTLKNIEKQCGFKLLS